MVNSKIGRARDFYRTAGWGGLVRRAAGAGTRLLAPLADNWRRIRAERGREEILAFNDFFYADLGVERAAAEALHDEICTRCAIPARPTESRHRLFFAARKLSGLEPHNILEIGTEHGETTQFLAELFAGADVFTVNLPADDPFYLQWHPEGVDRHDATLDIRLAPSNITALRRNTVWLQDEDLPDFDLIWLDGGHAYPEVAWDHFHAMHKLARGGWLFSDDISLPGGRRARRDPAFLHAHEVIQYFNARLDPGFRLLLKRDAVIEPLADAKYIACYHKESAS